VACPEDEIVEDADAIQAISHHLKVLFLEEKNSVYFLL
jgi:hypothetical protein